MRHAPKTRKPCFGISGDERCLGYSLTRRTYFAATWKYTPHSDIALQLPTGSGKTLVGLLVAEWRRRKYNERVVYLCPTRQLVNQVADQAASKYGIDLHAFTGSRKHYDPKKAADWQNAEAVAVTTYSSLFNTNPFFADANHIILDDGAFRGKLCGHILVVEHRAISQRA